MSGIFRYRLLLQLDYSQLCMSRYVPENPSQSIHDYAIPWETYRDRRSEEERTANDEPDDLDTELQVCQQCDRQAYHEEEQRSHRLVRTLPAVEIGKDFDEVCQVSQLHLNDWTDLFKERLNPVCPTMLFDQFSPGSCTGFPVPDSAALFPEWIRCC